MEFPSGTLEFQISDFTLRTLAIDLGMKRVGLALSDQAGRLATPLQVLQVNTAEQAVEPIASLVQCEGIEQIVVGLPLNMDGSIGPAARATLEWGKKLSGRTGIPLRFVDERLSSFQAEQELAQRKRGGERITRKRRKQSVDAMAAAGFLQQFLDGKLPAVDVK